MAFAVMSKSEQKSLGEYLAEIRLARGFRSPEKVEEAARRIGLRLRGRTIRFIEAGGTARPEAETLYAVARVYELDYPDLLRRAGYPALAATTSYAPDDPLADPFPGLAPDERELVSIMRRMRPEARGSVVRFLREAVALSGEQEGRPGPQDDPELGQDQGQDQEQRDEER